MNNRASVFTLGSLSLVNMILLSVQYRIGKTRHTEPSGTLQGDISFSFGHKRKYGFTMRAIQEISLADISFKARFEGEFASEVAIDRSMFDNEDLHREAINYVLPFGAELFANLSGKSFQVPIITTSELASRDKGEDEQLDNADSPSSP